MKDFNNALIRKDMVQLLQLIPDRKRIYNKILSSSRNLNQTSESLKASLRVML